LSSFRSLIPYLRRHRWSLIFGVLFVLLANATAVWIPILVGDIVNHIVDGSIDRETLFVLIVGMVAMAGISGGFRFLMRRVLIDVSRDVEYEFRNDLFKKLQSLDPAFFDNHNTGDLMSRATNDMDAVRMLMGPAVMYSANTIFSFPLFFGGMLLLDWKLTLVAMAPMLLLPPTVKYFGARTHKASKEQQDSFGELTTMVQENLAGIRIVKAYNQEGSQEGKFTVRNEDYIGKSLELAWLQSLFFPTIRLIVAVGYVALLLMGGYQIIQGDLKVGTLFSFLLLFASLVWPLIAAGWVVNILQRGLASLQRINAILDAEPHVKNAPDAQSPAGPMDIEFRALTFRYDGTDRDQLADITLSVPAGRTLGIVGPIGSGKSTLVNLLARLYPVQRGMITVAGRDLTEWPLLALRRRVAFVFQETFLFSDTIGWNIRFGAGDDAPQEAVELAAKRANVHDSIIGFPKQYLTVLGERGVNLSGGQKQRVAIARALLKDAEVLVLDDSLSAVDTHTEEAILGALKEVMAGRTTFLISHRISTVALADEIIVLEGGRITQRGTHEQLIAKPGLYGELHRKQLSEAAVEAYDETAEVRS